MCSAQSENILMLPFFPQLKQVIKREKNALFKDQTKGRRGDKKDVLHVYMQYYVYTGCYKIINIHSVILS